MLIECYECKAKISDSAPGCPHCGAVPEGTSRSVLVTVADLDIKLLSIFWVLVKFSLAAVGALMLLYTALTVFSGMVQPLLH